MMRYSMPSNGGGRPPSSQTLLEERVAALGSDDKRINDFDFLERSSD